MHTTAPFRRPLSAAHSTAFAALGFVLVMTGCEDPQTKPPQQSNPSASNSETMEAGVPLLRDAAPNNTADASSERTQPPSAPDATAAPSVDTAPEDASSLFPTPEGGASAALPTPDAAPTCAVDACNDQGVCIRRGYWTECNCAPTTLPTCTLPSFRVIGQARTNQERVLTLLSGDGRVAAGTHAFDKDEDNDRWESVGVTWTPSGGLQRLEQPASGSAIPTAINDDGSVIVGVMLDDHNDDRGEPTDILWLNGVLVPFTADAGVPPERNPIPDIPRTTIPEQTFEAFDATEDGRIVVGKAKRGTTPRFQFEAAVWVRDQGVYFLHDILPERGVSLINWRLWHVSAVSNDGSTMTGLGLGPDVGYRWYLRLPDALFN